MGQRPTRKTPQPLKRLLQTRGSQSGQLAGNAERFDRLGRLVAQALPAPLAAQCCGAVLEGDSLVLLTPSNAWSTQLRFYQQALLESVRRQAGRPLTRVRVRVVTPPPKPLRGVRREPNHLSARSRDVISAAADGITDKDLAAALRRLARKSD